MPSFRVESDVLPFVQEMTRSTLTDVLAYPPTTVKKGEVATASSSLGHRDGTRPEGKAVADPRLASGVASQHAGRKAGSVSIIKLGSRSRWTAA